MKQESHLEIAIASINCFSNDGTLDMNELNFLLGLALRDQVIDNEEKRVLDSIFKKIEKQDVTQQVWDRIETIRRVHDI